MCRAFSFWEIGEYRGCQRYFALALQRRLRHFRSANHVFGARTPVRGAARRLGRSRGLVWGPFTATHGWQYGAQPRRLIAFSLEGTAVLPPSAGPTPAGMPRFRHLTDEQLLALRHFIRQQAEAALAAPRK